MLKQFLGTHWKTIALVVGALVFGVLIGWYVKPTKIEEKVKIVEVEKQVVVVQEKVKVEIVHVKDTQVVERWHREKTEERRPDGTVTTKEVEDKNIDSIVKEKINSTEVKVVTIEKEIVLEKKVLVETKAKLPDWHVGVLAGVAPRFDNPIETSIVVGLEGERRIAGPFFVGVWGIAGSPVSGFKVTNATLGVKLGMDF